MSYNSTLDSFCGSQFWNSSLTWYTDSPELTPCFQKTVLVWTPCLYLWAAAFLDTYYILNSKERNIPWNILNISKLLITCLLIVLKFVDLGVTVHTSSQGEKEVFNADYYSPIIKILTFCLSATLLYYNRKYGMRASGVLFFFWLLLILAGLPQLQSEVKAHYNLSDDENVQYNFVSYMVYYPLIILMFLLNCFADLPPKDTPYKYEKNQCPENASGFPSRLTYSWFDPLALTGFRRSLTEEDLWALNPQDSSTEVVPKFDKFWEKSLRKREISNATKATYRKTSASVNFKPESEKKPASILPALCLAFGGQFLFGSMLKLFNDVLMFLSPQLLKLLIGFVQGKEPIWKGYVYAVALLACATVQTMLLAHYFTRMYLVGMRIRTALTSAIYRKSLRMSNSARKESTVGEIVNLMSVDAQRFVELTAYLNMIWSAPLQIALALYFLWGILGPSVLAGLAVMIILIPVNGLIANRVKTLQIRLMKYKDERVKLMNEVLNGIKVLKMYAWEPSFEDQILKIRNKEMNVLKQTAYLNSATSFIWSCAPFLVSLMSFGCFVLVNDTEVLDSKRAFVALSLFNILRFPLSMLPNVISNVVQTSVGIKRLNKFMNCDELDVTSVEHDPKDPNPISIENGHFTWGEQDSEPFLKNITLHVPRGSLIAVVGAVGSGKSSLLAALLGEMNKLSGRVNTTGTIAYVPQQAWIQNATLQDNILFGKPLDKQKYNNVIDMCALKPDFEVLPGGDQTEIGEKGINLSGGQKQRVSLARAVYCDADNYFLDDPLSAVDSHVGKHIFDKVLGPAGLLKHKTRVWVTHNVSYLMHTDLVVVLRDGEVSEAGSYQQLLEKKGAFADFLLHHLSDAERTSPEELDKIKQDLESKLGTEFQHKLQRARSLSESASESEQAAAGDRAGSVKRKTPEATPNELKEKNKLIEAEKTETGSVKWGVYKHYLMSVGILSSVITVLMNLILQVFQVGSNYWLTEWANDDKMLVNGTVDTKRRDMYLGVYGGLGIGQGDNGSTHALYLETIVEETSDDLRSERSSAATWLSDSDADSVIHVRGTQGSECDSESEREWACPAKRRRRERATSPASSGSLSRSSSLAQFESLERSCAAPASPSLSPDSLESPPPSPPPTRVPATRTHLSAENLSEDSGYSERSRRPPPPAACRPPEIAHRAAAGSAPCLVASPSAERRPARAARSLSLPAELDVCAEPRRHAAHRARFRQTFEVSDSLTVSVADLTALDYRGGPRRPRLPPPPPPPRTPRNVPPPPPPVEVVVRQPTESPAREPSASSDSTTESERAFAREMEATARRLDETARRALAESENYDRELSVMTARRLHDSWGAWDDVLDELRRRMDAHSPSPSPPRTPSPDPIREPVFTSTPLRSTCDARVRSTPELRARATPHRETPEELRASLQLVAPPPPDAAPPVRSVSAGSKGVTFSPVVAEVSWRETSTSTTESETTASDDADDAEVVVVEGGGEEPRAPAAERAAAMTEAGARAPRSRIAGFLSRFANFRFSGRKEKKTRGAGANIRPSTNGPATAADAGQGPRGAAAGPQYVRIPLKEEGVSRAAAPPVAGGVAHKPPRPRPPPAPPAGVLETDVDTQRTVLHARSLLALAPPDQRTPRPHKSMEFLLDKDNVQIVQPPENELQKNSDRVLSEHELRVQRSLQKLNVPEWYKNAPAPREGFLLRKRLSDASASAARWSGLNSKTTSLGSLGGNQQPPPPQLSPHTTSFGRWSTSRLNSNQTSPCSSTRSSIRGTSPLCSPSARSSFSARQPYLGWRSQERLNSTPRTPHERLASSLLQSTPKSEASEASKASEEIQTSIKEVTSAIVHYVSGLEPANGDIDRQPSPRSSQKLYWLESSFVGTKPLDSPQTPLVVSESLSTPRPPSSLRLEHRAAPGERA